jgi:hypothetical protein
MVLECNVLDTFNGYYLKWYRICSIDFLVGLATGCNCAAT